MSRLLLNRILLVILLVTVAIHFAIDRDIGRPNYEFLPEMLESTPFDAFAANPVFSNGRTLQEPPAGTIARGRLPLSYDATPESALLAGEELTNPFSMDDASAVERGREVYRIYCLPCHGPSGMGDGPVIMRGVPPPSALSGEKAVAMKDGQIFHLATYGIGNMPSYAAQIVPEDRWKAVLHVRKLQEKAAAQAAELVSSATQESSSTNEKGNADQ
jgi:mono/diheme cytochrome c family protein